MILTNAELDFKICQICQNFLSEKLNYSNSTIQHHFEYDYELQFLKLDYYTGVVKTESAKICLNLNFRGWEGGWGYTGVVKTQSAKIWQNFHFGGGGGGVFLGSQIVNWYSGQNE